MVRSERLAMSHNHMGSFHNRETALARSYMRQLGIKLSAQSIRVYLICYYTR